MPFTLGLYYIPESPPWLVYNQEEDLAFRSMSQIRLVGAATDKACMETACGASNRPSSALAINIKVYSSYCLPNFIVFSL